MRLRSFISNKKGEDIMYYTIFFIVLNLIFFSSLLFFVYKSSNGSLATEQIYSKKVALLLDESKPGMEYSIDFSKPIKLAEENGVNDREQMINIADGIVIVKLSNKGGYAFNYFSENQIQYNFDGGNLILKITENAN